jgi:hypothetical protein
MRRLVIISALSAALVAAAPAAGATLMARTCTTSCSTFQAGGKGWLSITGNGAEWGSISSGTIWVRDRTGNSDPRKWVHGTNLSWTFIGDDGWRVSSKYAMTISASTKFWIKLQGPGIQICDVVDGTGAISGTGKYTLNNHQRAWPSTATSLQF